MVLWLSEHLFSLPLRLSEISTHLFSETTFKMELLLGRNVPTLIHGRTLVGKTDMFS
jgi:hypothetical protein